MPKEAGDRTHSPAEENGGRDPLAEQAFVEEFAMVLERNGRLPRMACRIYGLMLISDRESVTQQDLAEELNASLASVSSMTRKLVDEHILERVALPGVRRDHFRLVRKSWETSIRAAQLAAERNAEIAEKGLALPGPDISPGRQQLREFRDHHRRFAQWLEDSVAAQGARQ